MREFAVLDSETDPFEHGRTPKPFVWGFYDGKEFSVYTADTFDAFIKTVSKRRVIIYAHNGGRFDYHFFTHLFEPYGKIHIINGRMASFRIGNAEFRDSFNIIPVALDKLEFLNADGTVQKKQEFDYSLMEADTRYSPDVWERIIDYLRDDCLTLYQAIESLQSQYGRKLTQAGASMDQWKKIVNRRELPKSSKAYFEEFEPWYFGGRVECFQRGIIDTRFSVYDINSAYPYAMMRAHPYDLEYDEYPGEVEGEELGPNLFIIEASSTGAFPFRSGGKLTFPSDGERREFYVTGWELSAAIDTNTAGDYFVKRAVYFPGKQSFDEYIGRFYSIRLQAKATGDKAGDLFAKLFMNSLYGKFGANPENYSDFMLRPESERNELDEDVVWYDSGNLGDWILAERDLEEHEMRFYNVVTAASITGFVRAYLWRAIQATGIKNMLYCDTDSIATSSEGHSLDTGEGLGKWKHEGEFDKAGICGKKLYIFRGIPDAKGKRENKQASKGARLTEDQLWQIASGAEVLYKPEAPTFSVHHAPRFISRRIKIT